MVLFLRQGYFGGRKSLLAPWLNPGCLNCSLCPVQAQGKGHMGEVATWHPKYSCSSCSSPSSSGAIESANGWITEWKSAKTHIGHQTAKFQEWSHLLLYMLLLEEKKISSRGRGILEELNALPNRQKLIFPLQCFRTDCSMPSICSVPPTALWEGNPSGNFTRQDNDDTSPAHKNPTNFTLFGKKGYQNYKSLSPRTAFKNWIRHINFF